MLRRQSSTEIDDVAKICYRSSFDEYDYIPQIQTLDEMEALKAFRNVILLSNQLWVETNKKWVGEQAEEQFICLTGPILNS